MQIRKAGIVDARAISELIRPLAEKHIAHEYSPEGAAINNFLGVIAIEILGPDDGHSESDA